MVVHEPDITKYSDEWKEATSYFSSVELLGTYKGVIIFDPAADHHKQQVAERILTFLELLRKARESRENDPEMPIIHTTPIGRA